MTVQATGPTWDVYVAPDEDAAQPKGPCSRGIPVGAGQANRGFSLQGGDPKWKMT